MQEGVVNQECLFVTASTTQKMHEATILNVMEWSESAIIIGSYNRDGNDPHCWHQPHGLESCVVADVIPTCTKGP